MSTTKETPQINTISLDNEERAFGDPQWKTGLKARFPWTGFIALFTIILCANSSLIVLLVSDGRRQEPWAKKIGPSVWLSAFNGIANICFGVAIANGVAITWWRKALKGSTIKELHRSWQFSSSIKDVVLYGKYFNVIALAALAAKLTIIDGILLQKAAGVEVGDDPARNITTSTYSNATMPFTATIDNRSASQFSLASAFTWQVDYWSRNNGMYPNTWTKCDGRCLFEIHGAGFGFDCTTETLAMDYGMTAYQRAVALSQTDDTSILNVTAEPTLFNLTFDPFYGATGVDDDYSKIIMNLTVSESYSGFDSVPNSCPGTVTRHSCILRPAVISYPVTVEDTTQNGKAEHAISNMYLGYNTTYYGGMLRYLDAGTVVPTVKDATVTKKISDEYDSSTHQLNNFSVVAYKDILEDHTTFTGDQETVIGGFVQVFNQYLAGSSSLRYEGIPGKYVLDQTGQAGVMPFLPTHDDTTRSCYFAYSDSLDYLIRQINQLTFALAVDPWHSNYDNAPFTPTNISAIQYGSSIHYKTNHGFMWGALASILVCILCVLPSYWGYWQLGRDVTLGPFEIANAFRAPILDHPSVANAGVKVLIREVGQREVKYGEMVQNDASGRLAIAEPEAVRRVHPRIHDRSM
jgi:hypothetical protein